MKLLLIVFRVATCCPEIHVDGLPRDQASFVIYLTPNEVRELEEGTFSSNGCLLLRRENGKEEGDSLLAHGKVGLSCSLIEANEGRRLLGGNITVMASRAKEEVSSSKVLLHESYFYETLPDSSLRKTTNVSAG
jgi:hypothetical protein